MSVIRCEEYKGHIIRIHLVYPSGYQITVEWQDVSMDVLGEGIPGPGSQDTWIAKAKLLIDSLDVQYPQKWSI